LGRITISNNRHDVASIGKHTPHVSELTLYSQLKSTNAFKQPDQDGSILIEITNKIISNPPPREGL